MRFKAIYQGSLTIGEHDEYTLNGSKVNRVLNYKAGDTIESKRDLTVQQYEQLFWTPEQARPVKGGE